MKRGLFLAILFCAFCPPLAAEEEARPVLLLEVKGTIDPALARYVLRGIEEARRERASAVVIQLDTPGGLDGSMRKIIQGILNSPVPVIVYVSPAGARAASAGAFITLAAHLAAMAPGTNIGAAHPVQLGGGDRSSPMEEKLTNDAVAYIRSIAELKGRNAAWAEEAVRESRSSPAEEAMEKKVIDLLPEDLDWLLAQAEGRQVKTVFGAATLSFKDRPRRSLRPSLIESGLHQLAHPNLAYILLLLGIYGLIYELATPGAVFPGVLGAILLVLALVALETLEVNWAGLALILLALIFFVADIKLPGYGALTAGGIVAFLLGSAILFPGARIPHLKLPWSTIGAAAATTAAFFLLIVGAGIRALRGKVTSGREGLIGAEGVAKTDLKPGGLVHVQGEEWQARAAEPVKRGTRVKVVELEGLTVHVQPLPMKEES
ncbi:MAG: nodulation protein NfeD [Candidatus Omnitrophica bacterium]|nr:nodulation protein NfeD [Candidatus Omnitrophota bacterium]